MEKYDSYKDSGVEWIGEIPSKWEWLKIKNLFSFSKGTGISKSDIEEDGTSKCILYGELFTRFKDFNVIPNEFSKTNLEDKIVSEGDELLIPGSTTTTSVDLCNCKALNHKGIQLGGDIIILKPRRTDIYNEFYSYYISSVTKPDFETGGRGVTIHHIYPKQIREIHIPYIPFSEQQQIVSFLDSKTSLIDSLIEKTLAKIELLKEKRTSLINELVTKGLNPNVEMKDCGIEWIGEIPSHWDLRKGSTIGRYSKGNGIKKDEVREVGLPCIRYGEIYTKYNHKFDGVQTYIEEGITNVKVSSGTLFMTGSGELLEDIGKCVVYVGIDDLYVGGDIIILKPSTDYHSEFLSYQINSESVRIQRELNGRGGIIVHIYSKNFKEMWFPTPPFSEQQQIVEYLDEQTLLIDKTISTEEKRIELLKEYRQSLISEVVTGKRKVV